MVLIWFFGLFGRDQYSSDDDLQDDPRDLPGVTPPRDLDLNLNTPKVTLRSRVKVRQWRVSKADWLYFYRIHSYRERARARSF